MISDIEHIILRSVDAFLEATAKEFDLPLPKLKENWKDILGKPTVAVSKKGVKKASLYQNFFIKKRFEMMQSDPTIQFGELSSQISKMWKRMTKEEQQAYGGQDVVVEAVAAVVDIAPPVEPGFDFESLNKKTMPELRKLCEEKGLRRTGNKVMLIHHLLGQTPKEVEKPLPVVKRVPPVPVEDTEDVEVVMAKNMKRADIEEEEEDQVVSFLEDEDEEGNFEFEEGSNYSVGLEDDD
jgi:HMG (high mobility group) box